MNDCKICKTICDNAGTDNPSCKQYLPVKTATIKVKDFYSFPRRIVVESMESGRQMVFKPVSL